MTRPFIISEVFSQNNFGNTLPNFPGFIGTDAGGNPVPPSLNPATSGSNAGITFSQRILTLDAAQIATPSGGKAYIPELINGNWNIVLDGSPTWQVTAGAFALSNGIPTCPLLARIGFGSGGAQNVVFVDVVPGNVISLPSMTAQVDILWGASPDFGINPTAAMIAENASVDTGGMPILPVNTVVTATATRTSGGVVGPAYRSIYMPRRGAAIAYNLTYPIPNLARKMRVYDQPGATIDDSGLYDTDMVYSFEIRNSDGSRPNRSKRFTGATMLALNESGVVIPKNATFLTLTGAASAANIGSNGPNRSLPYIEFELDL